MVPSPRKRAPRSPFHQTWDDTDAAFLDPRSLPVARIPRGWERRQETKKTEEGRERKIWRRFNLRSRAADAAEEEDEEENDVRLRAVKKRQQMSPEAMEKITSKLNGKKRVFKATRWDRRKSVLPRKKTSRTEDFTADTQEAADESHDAHDATSGDLPEETVADVSVAGDPNVEPECSVLPESADRRSTFTFTMEAGTVEDLPDYESLSGPGDSDNLESEEIFPDEDATIAHFFRSPVKKSSLYDFGSPEKVHYPQLPHSDSPNVESETHTQSEAMLEIAEIDKMDENMIEAEEGASVEEHQKKTIERDLPSEIYEDVKVVADANAGMPNASSEINCPALPNDSLRRDSRESQSLSPSEGCLEGAYEEHILPKPTSDTIIAHREVVDADVEDNLMLNDAEEEFTEASLQLNTQREYEEALRKEQSYLMTVPEEGPRVDVSGHVDGSPVIAEAAEEVSQQVQHDNAARSQSPVEKYIEDITDGLTLSSTPAKVPTLGPTPRKLHSPPPPAVQSSLDDATMTIALDDDTALLKDFLNRAAASRAEKAAVLTHRRESLQNRRDSDVIRHALASPRKALEDKDPNSPSKYDNELTLDLSQTLTLSMDTNALASPTPDQGDSEGAAIEKSLRGSRRSSRTKKSRLPAPATAPQAQTSKIAIRRADGNEHVVLKKSDAQELATLTRANTRKNKQGAFGVTVRLLKLAADAANLPPIDDSTKELILGKNIRWDEQLAYYQEDPETIAEAESLATPDELGMDDLSSAPSAKKSKISKNSTPKIRRVRGLGTVNGTPGKGLLAPASLLPEEIQVEKEAAQVPAQQLPRPKASKIKKMPVASTTPAPMSTSSDSKLPSLDIVPVGVELTKERKSRLAAPKKVILPQPTASLAAEGKENTQKTGISGATPKKGIPAPKVIVPPTVGMESGLPRRRGRKI